MKWEKVEISQLGEIITGNTPPRKNPELYGDFIPFIKPTDMEIDRRFTPNPEECYSELGFEKYRNSLIPKGATCVVTIGTIGKKMTQAITDCFINQAVNAVIPNENYDADFVFYLLKHNLDKVKGLDSGTSSGRENVSKSSFSSIEVNVVKHLPTQRKIASILSAYDDLIENNLKRIKLVKEKAQLHYKSEFGDYQVSNKDFDSLPKGWSVKSIGEIYGKLESGSRPQGGIDKELNNGIASVGAENVIGLGKYNFQNEKLITEAFFDNMNRGKIEDRDVLIYKDGAYIGKTTLFQDGFPHEKCCVNEHVFLLNTKDVRYQYFLFFTLNQKLYFEKMQQLNANAAQPGINQESLKSLKLIWPSEDKIEKFNKKIEVCVKLIFVLAKQNTRLREARDILLPRLMNGQIVGAPLVGALNATNAQNDVGITPNRAPTRGAPTIANDGHPKWVDHK
jgi:type I restriction enzyme S subunit